MKGFRNALLSMLLIGGASLASAGPITYTYSFSQSGFSDGGSITGFFRGTDLNEDGRIYAVGNAFVFFANFEPGNELDYLEATLTGFDATPDPVTLIYDKSVADMTAPENIFKGFAYNVDGGPIGDESNEGISLAFPVSSPGDVTLNYALGEAFGLAWNNSLGLSPDKVLTNCGDAINPCGAVFEAVFAPGAQSGFLPQNLALSNGAVTTTQVPIPGAGWLTLIGMSTLIIRRRSNSRQSVTYPG